MELAWFTGAQWEQWDVAHKPVVPDGMPLLIDDDLRFEDGPGLPRPSVAVNQWLRELPTSGGRSRSTWKVYSRVLRDWMTHLIKYDASLFGDRSALRSALSAYAVYRTAGPLDARYEASTWNQHMSVLGSFYRWAMAEGFAQTEPFSYKHSTSLFADQLQPRRVNLAVRRAPKPHVTIKYLDRGFADMFVRGLAGLDSKGFDDNRFRGRQLLRNTAVGKLALATGLRLQEFTYLLVFEIPPLPPAPTVLPIPFPVAAGLTKGGTFRTTWISYDALAAVHRYIALDRAMNISGSRWAPTQRLGEPLYLSEADQFGGRIGGKRVRWNTLSPPDRARLVAPGGGSPLLAIRTDGGPFTAWATVFRRTSDRIRRLDEPRFPHVHPHRTRHTFAMATLEWLVGGYYLQAAGAVEATGADAALILYLSQADPLMVLRDLLGHRSVMTTEKYLRRLDMTRIYSEAYERAGSARGIADAASDSEVDAEFDGEDR